MLRGILILFCAVVVTGCSAIQHPAPTEPTVIAIRNSTDMDIQQVSLSSASEGKNGAVRVGFISPLPKGVTQSIGRPTRAQSIPMQGRISWVNHLDRVVTRDISLKKVLINSTGKAGEALVFEILTNKKVQVKLEITP